MKNKGSKRRRQEQKKLVPAGKANCELQEYAQTSKYSFALTVYVSKILFRLLTFFWPV